MASKKKSKKQPNLRSRIVKLIIEQGPRPQKGMARILRAYYHTFVCKILELIKLGVLEKSDDGVLSLVPGVDLSQFGIEIPVSEKNQGKAETGTSESQMKAWSEGDFTHQEKFVKLLNSLGVRDIAKNIADLYFNGDVNNIHWLYEVLMVISKGFITEPQARMTMASWTPYWWGIPFDIDEFFPE
jgi:hypothetical protein